MVIASLSFGYFFLKLDAILGFWLVYILTRPLGASFGDSYPSRKSTAAWASGPSTRVSAS